MGSTVHGGVVEMKLQSALHSNRAQFRILKQKPNALRSQSQRGFSIIEVLVAVLILGVGLLGVAGMQLLSQQSDFEARQRAQAAFLANVIVERMIANASSRGDYNGQEVGGGVVDRPRANCLTDQCSPNQSVQYDLWSWESALDGAAVLRDGEEVGGLIAPTGCISVDQGRVTVTVAWRGQQVLAGNQALACGLNSDRYASTEGEGGSLRRTLSISAYIVGDA